MWMCVACLSAWRLFLPLWLALRFLIPAGPGLGKLSEQRAHLTVLASWCPLGVRCLKLIYFLVGAFQRARVPPLQLLGCGRYYVPSAGGLHFLVLIWASPQSHCWSLNSRGAGFKLAPVWPCGGPAKMGTKWLLPSGAPLSSLPQAPSLPRVCECVSVPGCLPPQRTHWGEGPTPPHLTPMWGGDLRA